MKERNKIMRFFGLHPQNDVRRRFAFTLAEGATHVDNSNNKRKFAFTLAEVLVTLGIIGVVAVLTVPNVISSYQKKVYVAQLQKVYNQISNAVALLMVDEEVDNLNDTYLFCDDNNEDVEDCYQRTGDFIKKYFKISKDCGNANESKGICLFSGYYKRLDGSFVDGTDGDGNLWGDCVSLSSGAVLCVYAPPDSNSPLHFDVDLNGIKGPNMWGRDAFTFDVNYRGEIAESFRAYPNHLDPEVNSINDPDRCLGSNRYGGGCFTKIINDGWKMDY